MKIENALRKLSEAKEKLKNFKNEIENLRKENSSLQKENEQLHQEISKLTGKDFQQSWYSTRSKKDEETKSGSSEDAEKRKKAKLDKANKNRGAKKGHKGVNRGRKKADQHEHLQLKNCPHCNNKITGKQSEKYTRQILELIQAPIFRIIEYHIYQAHCRHCKKTVYSDAGQLTPRQYVGTKAKALIALLKYKLNLSTDHIYQLINFMTTFDFHKQVISQSEIMEICLEVKDYGKKPHQEILDEIRSSPYNHWDETGLSCAGESGYTWAGQSSKSVYYTARLTRASRVVEEAMEDYKGVILADFYAGYRSEKYKIQRCWVHLLREAHKIKTKHIHDASARRLNEALHSMYETIKDEEFQEKLVTDEVFRNVEKVRAEKRFDNLIKRVNIASKTGPDAKRLNGRLEKYRDEILMFFSYPGIPLHNNDVERSMRTVARYRDICYGVQSQRGMDALSIGKSLVETFKLRGENEFISFQNIISRSH